MSKICFETVVAFIWECVNSIGPPFMGTLVKYFPFPLSPRPFIFSPEYGKSKPPDDRIIWWAPFMLGRYEELSFFQPQGMLFFLHFLTNDRCWAIHTPVVQTVILVLWEYFLNLSWHWRNLTTVCDRQNPESKEKGSTKKDTSRRLNRKYFAFSTKQI